MIESSKPPSSDSSASSVRTSRYAWNVLICAGLTTLICVGLYFRWGQPDTKDARLAWFREHADEFDILFFGSSISYQNVNLPMFEDELRRRGYAARTFTFGMGAADMHQIDWCLRAAFRMRPDRVKYVFIDLRPFELDVPERYRLTPPMIRWHDLRATRMALRTVKLADASLYEKRAARRSHKMHFITKYFPAGMFIAPPDQFKEEEGGAFDPANGGYQRYDPESARYRQTYKAFEAELPRYFEELERKRRRGNSPILIEHYNIEGLRSQIEFIRSHGATPIYWTAPSLHEYEFVDMLEGKGELPVVLRFDDPDSFGEFYELDLRLDRFHLTNEGTDLFTPLLARAFLDAFEGSVDLPAARPVRSEGGEAESGTVAP